MLGSNGKINGLSFICLCHLHRIEHRVNKMCQMSHIEHKSATYIIASPAHSYTSVLGIPAIVLARTLQYNVYAALLRS